MKNKRYQLQILTTAFLLLSLPLLGQDQMEVLSVKPISQLNTAAEENMPVLDSSNQRLFFMRTYIGNKKLSKLGQQIMTSSVEGENWSAPNQEFMSINDNANNAVIGVVNNGNRIYVFNSTDTRHKLAKGIGYMDLQEDGTYSSPVGVNIPGFEVGSGFYAFYITPDEQQLLISTAVDSSGYEDLFVSSRNEDGSWGALTSLGNQVNTPKIETTPFLSADKKTLYFSSDGHGGYGSADIFKTNRLDESWTNWSAPENLGEPINSRGFDAYYTIINQKRALFSSNRDNEFSDLYEIYFQKKATLITQSEEQLATLDLKGYLENKPSIQLKTLEDGMVEGSLNELEGTSMLSGTDGAALIVKNEKGEVVDTVYADQNGKFKFKQLPSEKLTLSLMGSDDGDLINVGVDDLLSQTEKLAAIETRVNRIKASGVSIVEDPATGILTGFIPSEKLNPNEDGLTPVVIKNELGETVDTLFADAEGKFIYKSLPEEQVSLALMGGADDEEMVTILLDDLIAVSALAEVEMGDQSTNADGTVQAQQIAEESGQTVSDESEIVVNLTENEAGTKPQLMVENNKQISNEVKDSNANEQVQFKLYFDFDSYAIQDTATNRIDAIINSLNRSAIKVINVTGYTDTSGHNLYNDLLSEKRAQAAKDYLIKKGLPASDILVDAKGERNPDFPNDTRRGRILNRRVKVVVVYND
jgi:outer membrane protein OmpA-like peptidoglycan-associated protein